MIEVSVLKPYFFGITYFTIIPTFYGATYTPSYM